MDPRFSLKKYPRVDVIYKTKSSLDFMMISSNVYENRKKNKLESGVRWVIHFIIAFVVGAIAFYMDIFEEYLMGWHLGITQDLITKGEPIYLPYFYWVSFSVVCAFIGAALTVYVGPGAAGSGVAEVIGLLNGVRYPKALDIATLVIKIVGVELAVISNLAVGKEGPLVAIGAICGCLVPYLPFSIFEPFRNDSDKRTFIAAGAAAGISAAFGAPIGGALFAYEISKPNTFWSFSMLWRVFFTSAFATLTLGILQELNVGDPLSLNTAAVLKYGEISYFDVPMGDFLISVFLGTIGGLMGAFFCYIYAVLGYVRKQYVNTNIKKIIEVMAFSFVSASLFFWLSYACKECYQEDVVVDYENYVSFQCPKDYYNPQATLYLNSEGAVIRALMNDKIKDTIKGVGTFTLVWYILMITTQGVTVPSGLFLPGMLIGSGMGYVLKESLIALNFNLDPNLGSSYQIIGAVSYMAGYTRQTYSLAVVMLETTQTINFFIPIILAVMVSVGVAGIFNRSLYERALRSK